MTEILPQDISFGTGQTQARYINQNSLVRNTFKPYFHDQVSEFIIPKNVLNIMDNNQTSYEKSGYKMMKDTKIETPEEVLSMIKTLANKDRKFLNHKYSRKKGYGNLVYNAVKYFGTWYKAVLASGEQPLYIKWSKEKVIEEIKKLYHQTGKVPNYKELVKQGNVSLCLAARNYLGSWAEAVKTTGLKPYRNNFWTKESLIQELKEIVNKLGHVPPKRELNRLGRNDLVSSGTKMFGSYNNLLRGGGFEPILIPNIWTENRIKEEINQLSKIIKRTPTERDMVAYGKNTIKTASIRKFKSWNDAIKASDLIPNENCVKDKIWKIWEDLALEVCSSLYSNSEKHKKFPNKSIPDFYDYKNKLIIEIKTNASDSSIHQNIVKYEPYCDRIEIWYLIGKPINIKSKKAIFRGPNEIREILQKLSNKNLVDRFDDLIKSTTNKTIYNKK